MKSLDRPLSKEGSGDTRQRKWLPVVFAIMTLLATLLGGATAVWSQVPIIILTGLLLLVAPPTRSLGGLANVVCVVLLGLALAAFIPAHWFPLPEWRHVLIERFGLTLGGMRTAEPWLTFQSMCLLFLGVTWAYALLQHPWSRLDQNCASRVFGVGMLAIAMLAIVSYLLKIKVPFWPHVGNSTVDFGFLPNRNHTANVLALGGITFAALALEDWREAKSSMWLWFAGLGVVTYALIVAYSRAGILLFFGGTALWAIISVRFSGAGKNGAVNCALAALLMTALFLFGGDTLHRFAVARANADVESVADFRVLVQEDAFELSTKVPLLGVGLGNFEPVFAVSRDRSGHERRAIHPESDWLWSAVEMGWGAPFALLCAVSLWMGRCFPLARHTRRVARIAAMICGLGFVVHGLIDVSGHRIGSLWPALFLMGMALCPDRPSPERPWVPIAFRVIGCMLLLIGGAWALSLAGWGGIPTSVDLERSEHAIDACIQRRDYVGMIRAANQAIRIAPLDPSLYRQRALGEAASGDTELAIGDFRLARYLEPNWAQPCFDEGGLWLALQRTDYALEAWRAAIKSAPDGGISFYRQMLAAAGDDWWLRDKLGQWARIKPAFLLAYLASASRAEYMMETNTLWIEDPELRGFSSGELRMFFELWSEKGDSVELANTLMAHREWRPLGWRFLARYRAEQKDFREAYQVVREFAQRPTVPETRAVRDQSGMEREFYHHPEDVVLGLALYGAQANNGRLSEALETVRTVRKQKAAPGYVAFVEAELCARIKDWEHAWCAWQEYDKWEAGNVHGG